MAETAETKFDEFKRKDCVFVLDWLKTKGLHRTTKGCVPYLKVFKNDLYR